MLDALSRHLSVSGLQLDGAAGAKRLSGGLSNLNYLVRVNGKPAVLRRPPPGPLPLGAHDMAREHRVLSRLSKALPLAPDSFHLCDDVSVIGAPFQLLEYRTGLVVQGDRLPPELGSEASRRALSGELVQTLAAIHAVDANAVGLGDLGRPEGFFTRTAEGWGKRGAAVIEQDASLKTVARICDWLRSHAPAPLAPTLLHSDFKLDNCMLSPDHKVTTVLDWDMGTRGDPLMDVATLMSYWTERNDPPCMHRLAQMPTAAPGFLSRREAVDMYGRISGRDVSAFPVWRILALLKLGIVFLQLDRNWRRGAMGGDGDRGFGTLGAEILDYACDCLHGDI
jgi:aminoglycoside phosphotransferase (APT) family kinase protein